MKSQKTLNFWIKLPYWLGIAADALWAIALLVPSFYSILTQNPEFKLDFQIRIVMGIGGSLMTAWTFLLIWALMDPVQRRVVGLLTAFPLISGLFIFTLIGNIEGNTSNIWILIKLVVLFALFITSFILAGKKTD